MNEATSLKSWFRRPFDRDRRKAIRRPVTGLFAYFWTGGDPVAYAIPEVSASGMYLVTDQRWYLGTSLILTLQTACGDPPPSIAVRTRVIRNCEDGVGMAFSLRANNSPRKAKTSFRALADKKALVLFMQNLATPKGIREQEVPMYRIRRFYERCVRRPDSHNGQALIEFALLLPMLLLLIVNVVNFGGFFYAWITVANAARTGADYAVLGGASAGNLVPATGAQIVAVVTQDTSSLPNAASLSVGVCQNNNGAITVLTGSCSSTPLDPQAPDFVLTTVQVSYTYQPFIPASFQFANLGVYATLPPITITRWAYMRSLS